MSTYPSGSGQPTPVPAPTAEPTYWQVPHIPLHADKLLNAFADAIDTANKNLNGHASKLGDVRKDTGNAVNDVVNNSKGNATNALHDLWGNSDTDLGNAHDPLTTITSAKGLGSGPHEFRTVLNEHQVTIQAGLAALENLQKHQDSNGFVLLSTEQLRDWKRAVDALDSSLGNINMALDVLAIAISGINNGFQASCATNLIPGTPPPLFHKNAFAHQANGDSGGGSKGGMTEEDLADYLKEKKHEYDYLTDKQKEDYDLLPLAAADHFLTMDKVKALLDTGVNPALLSEWIEEDEATGQAWKITDKSLSELKDNVQLLGERGGVDPTVDATWLEGLNEDQLANLKNRADQSRKMNADNLRHLVDPKREYDPNPKHDIEDPEISPQPTDGQRVLNNSVAVKEGTTMRRVGVDPKTGEIAVIDDTNNGKYHGHVRPWDAPPPRKGLTQKMKNALKENGLIDDQGRIILRDDQGNITGYGKNVIKGR